MGKFRELKTSKGTLIHAGKNAGNNEELIKQSGKDEEVFHTAAPGSPFVNIKGKAKLGDIKKAALFCAAKSQDWRDNHKDVIVHWFKGKDIYKIKGMKLGTFGIKKYKLIKLRKLEIERFLKSLGKTKK